ncbi:MAG: PAS domain S-box protein [Phycisphaerales bacterium]|nr:PAS domain S-box protein [Phycisphaerales bacterium]
MSERARSSNRWRGGLAESLWGTVALLTLAVGGFEIVVAQLLVWVLPAGLRPWQFAAVDALLLGLGLSLFIRPLLIGPLRARLREHRDSLAHCVASTALVEGDEYHRAMVACLGEQLHASYAAVAEVDGDAARTIASWSPGGPDAPGADRLAGTPWARVLGGGPVCDARGAAARRPSMAMLAGLGAEFFIGVPISDGQGGTVGLVVVVGGEPLGDAGSALTLTRLLAARAGAELRRAAEARRETALRRRQDAIMRLIDDTAILSITDRSGRITHVNDTFCEIAGYSREELIGQDHRLVNSGHHPRTLWRDLYQAAVAGRVWEATVRNRRKDGSHYWLKAGVIGVLDERGALEEIVSVRSDVTEIVEADQRARVLGAAMESSPAAICVLDAGGRITIANRAFRELFDLPPEGDRHATINELMHNQEVREEIQAVMAEGLRLELRIRLAPRPSGPRDINLLDGRERGGADPLWFDLELAPIADDGSAAGCFICVLRDVDDQVRGEHRLRLEAEGRRIQMEIAAILDDDSSELRERLTGCVRSLVSLDGLDLMSKGGVFLAGDDGLRLCVRDGEFGEWLCNGEGHVARGECLCGRVLQDGEAGRFEVLVSDDCFCDPRHEIRYEGMSAHGHYIVPLQWAGRCEGVMFLYTEPSPTHEAERLDLLLRIGEQMGGAIVRDRLHAAASRDEKEASLAADFAALRGACVAVLNTGRIPIEERVREVLDYVCASGNLGFRGSASAFVTDDSGMRLLAAHGDEDPGDATALPLVHRGEALGELAIGVDTEGVGETVRREFLVGLAELIAGALHSERLEQRTARARRDKRDILFTMGREMRTPMTSIVAAADMLREEGVAESDRDELAAMIRRNADHLLSVVDNVLDLSGANSESSLRAIGELGTEFRELRGARILLLEHDEGAAEAVATALRGAGSLVEVSRRAEIGVAMALGAVRAGRPHALVIMTERAAITEVELAPRLLRENGYPSPIVVLVGADPDAGLALLDAGADLVLPAGPFAAEEVLQAAADLVGQHRDQRAA